MQRFLILAGMLILAGALQGNTPSWLMWRGAQPDFLLVVLIATALMLDPLAGAVMGFVAGLMQGSMVGFSIGSFIVSRTLIGFVAGTITLRLFSENPMVPMIAAVGLTFLSEAVFLLTSPTGGFIAAVDKILITSLYNGLLTAVAFWILRKFEIHKKVKHIESRL